jgi:hypothetical protein
VWRCANAHLHHRQNDLVYLMYAVGPRSGAQLLEHTIEGLPPAPPTQLDPTYMLFLLLLLLV